MDTLARRVASSHPGQRPSGGRVDQRVRSPSALTDALQRYSHGEYSGGNRVWRSGNPPPPDVTWRDYAEARRWIGGFAERPGAAISEWIAVGYSLWVLIEQPVSQQNGNIKLNNSIKFCLQH